MNEIRCEAGRGCRGLVGITPWPRWVARVVEARADAQSGAWVLPCSRCGKLHEIRQLVLPIAGTATAS